MKRALFVLALAVLSSAGCRAINPQCGQPVCGDACVDSCGSGGQPCHMAIHQNAPRPGGSCEGYAGNCGRGGSMEGNCPGGNCCMFDRHCGSNCGCGYPVGQYDCSPCNSPNWGCNGHRHPQGYMDGRGCFCQNGQGAPNVQCQKCGRGYCCGGPGMGCQCCPFCGCGPSGDHIYNFNPGPPVAQTAYPYYTLRGPRDFLLDNPPTIGPY